MISMSSVSELARSRAGGGGGGGCGAAYLDWNCVSGRVVGIGVLYVRLVVGCSAELSTWLEFMFLWWSKVGVDISSAPPCSYLDRVDLSWLGSSSVALYSYLDLEVRSGVDTSSAVP